MCLDSDSALDDIDIAGTHLAAGCGCVRDGTGLAIA